MLPEKNPIIVRIVLDKFDQESVYQAIGKHKILPVKIFVNCKSSKKTQVRRKEVDQKELDERKRTLLAEQSININDKEILSILKTEDELDNFEVANSAEIHFNGKENIEGFATLVNIFLRSMLMTTKHPCLVNVSNVDTRNKPKILEDALLFYQSTIVFKDEFTKQLALRVPSLQTINVHINYSSLLDGTISHSQSSKIGSKTFSYMGLRQSIRI